MFRKFVAVVAATLMAIGGLCAEDLKGVFKKYENGTATVEVDGKLKEYKVVRVEAKIKYKKSEIPLTDVFKNIKEGAKGTFSVENGVIVKVQAGKGHKEAKMMVRHRLRSGVPGTGRQTASGSNVPKIIKIICGEPLTSMISGGPGRNGTSMR